MLRSVPLSILALGAVAVSATPAQGASLRFPRSCYLFGEQIGGAQATGFRPNSRLKLDGDKRWLGLSTVQANGAGVVPLTLLAPNAPAGFGKLSVMRVNVKITDPRHRSRRAHRSLSFSNLTVDAGQEANPLVRRTWRFAGVRGTGALYGHFLFNGRVIHTHRFGMPKGPCGVLRARATAIPIPKSKLRAGEWTVQFDRSLTYIANRADSLTQQTTLPKRYNTGK